MGLSWDEKVAAIADLLTTLDGHSIDQGIEIVLSLDEPEIVRQLLAGVRLQVRPDGSESLHCDNGIFSNAHKLRPWSQYAMYRLIAISDSNLRDQIRHVVLGRGTGVMAGSRDWKLGWLTQLPNLERLVISPVEGSDLSHLDRVLTLRTLVIVDTYGRRVVLPELQFVETVSSTGKVSLGEGRFPNLRSLKGDVGGETISARNAPRLVNVDLRGDAELVGFTELGVASFKYGHTKIPGCERIHELSTDVRSLFAPDLRFLKTLQGDCSSIDPSQLKSLEAVRPSGPLEHHRFPQHTHLQAAVARFTEADFGKLDHPNWVKSLDRIQLERVDASVSLEGLRAAKMLRSVEFHDSSSIPDLSPLRALPKLAVINFLPQCPDGVVPEDLWHLVRSSNGQELQEVIKRPARKRGAVPCDPLVWLQLQTDLRTARHGDEVLAVVNRAATLGSEVVDAIIANISLENGWFSTSVDFNGPLDYLMPAFIGSLLESSPTDSREASRLRHATSLRFRGDRHRLRRAGRSRRRRLRRAAPSDAVQLSNLGQFTGAETLTVTNAAKVKILDLPPNLRSLLLAPIGDCWVAKGVEFPKLTSAALFGGASAWLPVIASPQMQNLQVSGPHELDFRILSEMPALERLVLSRGARVTNAELVRELPLRSITVGESSFDLEHLVGHPTLEEVALVGEWRGVQIPPNLPVAPRRPKPRGLVVAMH